MSMQRKFESAQTLRYEPLGGQGSSANRNHDGNASWDAGTRLGAGTVSIQTTYRDTFTALDTQLNELLQAS